MIQNTTSVEDLFENIRSIKNPPSEEIFNAIESSQIELTEKLIKEIRIFSEDPSIISKQGDDYIRHVISIYLLAYYRVTAAYPHIIKLISYPGDKVIQLTGEVFTEALGRILASVYDGDLQPIKSVIENQRLSPWIRSGALDSMMVLWKEDALKRSDVVSYLRELMQGKLERKPGYVWDTVALIAYDIHPGELESLLLDAIKENLIESMVLNEELLRNCVKNEISDSIKNKDNIVEGYMKSPIKELTWWLYPDDEALDKGMEYAAMAVPLVDKKVTPGERGSPVGWRADTVIRNEKKLGRNAPCFCGSGKKYKRCCGG